MEPPEQITDEEIEEVLAGNRELAAADPEIHQSLVDSLEDDKHGRLVPLEVAWKEAQGFASRYRLLHARLKTSA